MKTIVKIIALAMVAMPVFAGAGVPKDMAPHGKSGSCCAGHCTTCCGANCGACCAKGCGSCCAGGCCAKK